MVFLKNIRPPKTNFGIDLSIFFNDYEKLRRNPMYTERATILNDNDINELLRILFM